MVAHKKVIFALGLIFTLILTQSFMPKDGPKKGESNLKILPKDISDEELHRIMKEYSMSLGVKCGFCHAPLKSETKGLDFASDEKHEKIVARKMMKMTAGINKKYIDKMDHPMEHITCVTCHMGSPHPEISADSLKTK
jgi:hypothetical protein